jgi:hypothetical protein
LQAQTGILGLIRFLGSLMPVFLIVSFDTIHTALDTVILI